MIHMNGEGNAFYRIGNMQIRNASNYIPNVVARIMKP
jgi:hypothetical protein